MHASHRSLAIPLAALLALGLAAQVSAAPAASYSATLTASSSCLLTVTTSSKNAKVAQVFVGWYEAGYQSPDYPTIPDFIATSAWPATGPNAGVAKGKTVLFTFGPTGTDATTHDWHGLVSFYDANGAALAQISTNILSTTCFVPSPA